MLKNMHTAPKQVSVPIAQAEFPQPFPVGLEYSAPARGTQNIVFTGLSIPEAHSIFVCPQGCLRGVVLTAADIGASDRFSTIAVGESNVLEGNMEDQIIDGVGHIIDQLPVTPPAVLVYTSCVHQFLGIDLHMVFGTLRANYPAIQFTDCYMNPIMRKSGWNPDQKMRRQLYSLLKPAPLDEHAVNILANDYPLDHSSDLYQLLSQNHYTVREVATCKSYADYQKMATSKVAIVTRPAGKPAGKLVEKKLGQQLLYLPLSYNYEEIIQNLQKLSAALGLNYQPDPQTIAACDQALAAAQAIIGNTPIALDGTLGPRPLGLARLLLEHGFRVTDIYIDMFNKEEKADFAELQAIAPDLAIHSTLAVGMRVAPRTREEKVLAIGQKAAYFTATAYFVNLIKGSGLYGFDGIQRLASLMVAAYQEPKDTQALIQTKSWGCGCL